MRLTLQSVPRRRAGVELEHVGDQAVMLDATGTVARGLNGTAARVWGLIDGQRSAAQIAVELEGEGDVEGDVLAFLGALLERRLIEV